MYLWYVIYIQKCVSPIFVAPFKFVVLLVKFWYLVIRGRVKDPGRGVITRLSQEIDCWRVLRRIQQNSQKSDAFLRRCIYCLRMHRTSLYSVYCFVAKNQKKVTLICDAPENFLPKWRDLRRWICTPPLPGSFTLPLKNYNLKYKNISNTY